MRPSPQPTPFLSVTPLAVALAGGWEYFVAAMALLLLALSFNYTRRGSGINQHPYGNPYTNAPGSYRASTLSHDQDAAARYTRGTR